MFYDYWIVEFSDTISASPTLYYKTSKLTTDYQVNNSLSSAFHCTSPFNLKCKTKSLARLKNQRKSAFDHNNEFLEIVRLVYRPFKFALVQ